MQIGTNTLLLALAAMLALGVAYLMVAAPSWGGGVYAAGAGCGMMGGAGGRTGSSEAANIAGSAGGTGAVGGGCGCGGGGGASCGAGGPDSNGTSGVAPGGSAGSGQVQDVYVKALGGNNFGKYDKLELRVKNNVPVRLHFTAEPGAGCGSVLVIYGMNVRITSRNGQEAVAEFTPQKAGTYTYSCGMMMFGPGKLIVE